MVEFNNNLIIRNTTDATVEQKNQDEAKNHLDEADDERRNKVNNFNQVLYNI